MSSKYPVLPLLKGTLKSILEQADVELEVFLNLL